MKNKGIVILIAIFCTAALVYVAYQWYKKYPSEKDLTIQVATDSVAYYQQRQDSLQLIILKKDLELRNQQVYIDSIEKIYERQKNKPKPDYLRDASIQQLDSFWSNH